MPPLADLPEIEESETVALDDPTSQGMDTQSSMMEQTPPPDGNGEGKLNT